MKFENGKFYKHKNCIDAFIKADTVGFDSGARCAMYAKWYSQGVHAYWCCQLAEPLIVTIEHYDNWEPYEPKGELYY